RQEGRTRAPGHVLGSEDPRVCGGGGVRGMHEPGDGQQQREPEHGLSQHESSFAEIQQRPIGSHSFFPSPPEEAGLGHRGSATVTSVPCPDRWARFYYDLVYNSLHEAARRALEAMMKGYEYQSDFAKKYVAQGLAEGLTKGRIEGRTEEAARAVLTVL